MKSNSKNKSVALLSICGQVAEHKSEMMQLHGGNEDMILSALSEDEQAQLVELLTKLQKAWLADHAKHHQKHD